MVARAGDPFIVRPGWQPLEALASDGRETALEPGASRWGRCMNGGNVAKKIAA